MRNAVGIFGTVCGIIIVGLVARYGYKTTDDAIDALIVAFLFGVMASAGLAGHAVAVRLWKNSRWASIGVGLVCAAALVINLSNSLGAIAGRSEGDNGKRLEHNRSVKAAETELQRLTNLRNGMPVFVTTDADAVAAAKRAADAATTAKERECGNGKPQERGTQCRAKEDAEAAAMKAWREASASKATTDRADQLEADAGEQRTLLQKLGPKKTIEVQGSAFARLFRLPDSEAGFLATLQQFGMAVIAELIIVMCFIAWEKLPGRNRTPTPHCDQRHDVDVVPEKLSPPPRPRLVAASDEQPAGSIPKILTAVLEPAKGQRVEYADVYRRYVGECTREGKRGRHA